MNANTILKVNQDNQKKNAAKNDSAEKKPEKVVILDSIPEKMTRPIFVHKNFAYIAVFLPTGIEDSSNEQGFTTKYKNVKISLHVLRHTGDLYGEGGNYPIEALPFEVHLPLEILPVQSFSPVGVKAYMNRKTVSPLDVFQQLKDLIDYYIDFQRSLADQETMCELIATYIMSTWFIAAINVVGYLWFNGVRGSGKTELLHLITLYSHLGLMLLAGSTYATLRDVADMGGTIGLDDAENLSDPKSTDPDKRALVLAGNRKGALISVKEPDGKNGWKIRHVNAFSPRVFSAIKNPETVLASRSIIIPLIASYDSVRRNRQINSTEPQSKEYKQMIDNLWHLALWHQIDVKEQYQLIGQESPLMGRNLQPWHAVFAIAKWLENAGVENLYQRIVDVAVNYQNERQSLEYPDLTYLVIRAIVNHAAGNIRANSAFSANSANTTEDKDTMITFNATQIYNIVLNIIDQDEIDFDKTYVSPNKIGRIFGKLRILENPRPGGKGPRIRSIKVSEIIYLAKSYSIEIPPELSGQTVKIESAPTKITGSNGSNGTDGSPEKNCYTCKTNNWVERPEKFGGGYYCATCHPNGD